jgi:hypothetical protein
VAVYNGPADKRDEATDLAVDSAGNVYVTGGSQGNVAYYDYATVKYDSAGNELWVARYNNLGSDYDFANALAIDSAGNVYVTGESYGDGSSYDYATVKYDTAGNELWVASYNCPLISEWDVAQALAVDSEGNAYVTGRSYGGSSNEDYATVKYIQTIEGDLNGDSDVDRDDLTIILSYRNDDASYCPECDMDHDGVITALDARKLVMLCTRPRCAVE